MGKKKITRPESVEIDLEEETTEVTSVESEEDQFLTVSESEEVESMNIDEGALNTIEPELAPDVVEFQPPFNENLVYRRKVKTFKDGRKEVSGVYDDKEKVLKTKANQ